MDCEPGEIVGWEIDHQHDGALVDLVGWLEQRAGDPISCSGQPISVEWNRN